MITILRPGRFFAIAALTVIVLSALVFRLVWGSATVRKSGEFVISQGQNASQVWQELQGQRFVSRTLPLRYYGNKYGASGSIQAGTYRLEIGEHVRDIIQRFVSGSSMPGDVTITYPEGFTLRQIAVRTAGSGIGTEEEFMEIARPENFIDEFPFLADIPANRSLEGYLFPDTYRMLETDTPRDVILRMLANFRVRVGDDLLQEAAAAGRSLDDIVIMASIIEREVIQDRDMALVADVLWKRLDEGIGLYADATIRYILDKWDGPLTVQDLDVDSLYNSRKYRDLPPGPISNPGLRAIIAAVRPEPSDYYYYLSAPSGETIFSKTNDEHNENKFKYLR